METIKIFSCFIFDSDLAQMGMESPEQKKQVFLVLKKRPTEALFKTIEILLFL
jgi:hypothetical protein